MFDDRIITLAPLATFELPGHTIRASDGGLVKWGSEIFLASDPDFGTIASVGAFEEESGDQAPAMQVTFLPKDGAPSAILSSPSYQMAPARFWMAEVDPATGEVIGDPLLMGDMEVDITEIEFGGEFRRLSMALVSADERQFMIYEGNTLSEAFHKSVWPGETGLDNATGVGSPVAWGVAGPPRGSSSSVGGGSAGGSGGIALGLAARA